MNMVSVEGLTFEERHILALMVTAQHLRTVNFREYLDGMDRGIEECLRARGAEPTTVKLCFPGCNPDNAPTYHRMNPEEIKRMSLAFFLKFLSAFTPILETKHCVLLHDKRGELLISDNPVCLDNEINKNPMGNLRIKVLGIEIYLPISPSLCVGLLCPKTYSALPTFIEVNEAMSARLNCLQVVNSSRCIYSPKSDFSQVRSFLESQPHFTRPQRVIVS